MESWNLLLISEDTGDGKGDSTCCSVGGLVFQWFRAVVQSSSSEQRFKAGVQNSASSLQIRRVCVKCYRFIKIMITKLSDI